MTYHQEDSLFSMRGIQWNVAIVISSAAHFSVKYSHTNWNRTARRPEGEEVAAGVDVVRVGNTDW